MGSVQTKAWLNPFETKAEQINRRKYSFFMVFFLLGKDKKNIKSSQTYITSSILTD